MRFLCPHCDSTGYVKSFRRPDASLASLFSVQCKNLECGHTWVVEASPAVYTQKSALPDRSVDIPASTNVRKPKATHSADAPWIAMFDEEVKAGGIGDAI